MLDDEIDVDAFPAASTFNKRSTLSFQAPDEGVVVAYFEQVEAGLQVVVRLPVSAP